MSRGRKMTTSSALINTQNTNSKTCSPVAAVFLFLFFYEHLLLAAAILPWFA
jgi:hypothetical protein